jgi:hypothetical protein
LILNSFTRCVSMRRDHPADSASSDFSTQFNAIGHMQLGLISDLLAGQSVAANIVILILPNLILTCGFPWPGLPCQFRCDLQTYTPVWPEPRQWQQMSKSTPPLPTPAQDAEFFLSLAEKIELHLLVT